MRFRVHVVRNEVHNDQRAVRDDGVQKLGPRNQREENQNAVQTGGVDRVDKSEVDDTEADEQV